MRELKGVAPVKKRFDAELILGHKGVVAALVPFDPEVTFRRKPTRLAGRRHGWPVRASVNGASFDGYVGERWGRFFLALDEMVRSTADVSEGDTVSIEVTPSSDPEVVAAAIEQSAITTQPSKARADAIAVAVPVARATAKKGAKRKA
jgi:hypothetical protein